MSSDNYRFQEIIGDIKGLIEEAIELVPDHARARAESYWYAQIAMALDEDHGYMGGCMCSMQDTLEDFNDIDDEDDEDCE